MLCCPPAAGKALGPLLFADLAVLVIPEALEHVGVVQQRANATGELGPDQVFDQVGSVERTQLVQERLESGLLGKAVLLVNIGGVGRVESDPQEDKATIDIVSLLGTIEPTQCPMNTQGEVGVMTFTLQAMTGLECLIVHGVPILEVMGSTSTEWGCLKTLHIFWLNPVVGREVSIQSQRTRSICLPVQTNNMDGGRVFA
ncbi:hypothetical protein D3C71_1016520 [compost metagenome]